MLPTTEMVAVDNSLLALMTKSPPRFGQTYVMLVMKQGFNDDH